MNVPHYRQPKIRKRKKAIGDKLMNLSPQDKHQSNTISNCIGYKRTYIVYIQCGVTDQSM